MAGISKNECTCAHLCPDAQCVAVWIHETNECWVACSSDPIKMLPPLGMSMDAMVSVEVRGATMATVGSALAKIAAAELLIPAESVTDTVLIEVEETSLGELIDEIGLVVRDSG